jgi:hypothetical protein
MEYGGMESDALQNGLRRFPEGKLTKNIGETQIHINKTQEFARMYDFVN